MKATELISTASKLMEFKCWTRWGRGGGGEGGGGGIFQPVNEFEPIPSHLNESNVLKGARTVQHINGGIVGIFRVSCFESSAVDALCACAATQTTSESLRRFRANAESEPPPSRSQRRSVAPQSPSTQPHHRYL